jgi:hypothetical protein
MDQRFLRLIRNMMKAGYLEDWEYQASGLTAMCIWRLSMRPGCQGFGYL